MLHAGLQTGILFQLIFFTISLQELSEHLITPKLIIAVSVDNIAPWNDVRSAYWQNAPAPGTFAVIRGANHGFFMDYSYSWENGGTATITRAEQLRITRRHMTAFFQRYLKNDTTLWNYHYCFGDSIYRHRTMDTVEVRYGVVPIKEQKKTDNKNFEIKIFPIHLANSAGLMVRITLLRYITAAVKRLPR
jgi:hypothetical protein